MNAETNPRVLLQFELERHQIALGSLYSLLVEKTRAGRWSSSTRVVKEIDEIKVTILELQVQIDKLPPIAAPQFLRKQAD